MKHHGIVQPRGLNESCPANRSINEHAAEAQRFGRLFPHLPRLISNPDDLEAVGQRGGVMDADHGSLGATTTPLGYVFFGQFIDHDITLDVTSSFNRINDPSATRNFRTPALDLDCVYGSGPEASPYLYYQAPDNPTPRQAEIRGRHLLTDGDDLVRAPSAPEGNTKRAALIGDPRNDENRMVSQIQLAMHYFHNAVVDYVLNKKKANNESTEDEGIFEEAQKIARWHYQWVVVNDFLPRMVGKELVVDILSRGPKLYCIKNQPYIPVEFAVAAYRFGHTMVTRTLNYNSSHSGVELFGSELGQGFTVNNAGIADMSLFFGPGAQTAGAVDILMQSDLLDLPFMSPDTPAHMRSLATRNLLRGQSFGLPSGQEVHAHVCEVLGEHLPAPDMHMLDMPEALVNNTPLWLYILAEGMLSGGQKLGPVGGRIVAEVLIGVLESDNTSYLGADRSWRPTLPYSGDVWDMEALINFANMPS
ncbi:heme peroxidase family protein [Microbulbifer bruguierae]|uniref:Heme peroxidase family protein n=1 Tax=Microbulbifer bruguierae TaxID=3029061 RepID=A0ABY8NE42_9GAMM|nr:heme peroxidase family protein [Microbulbifer bruguierae]WGL17186.1 heme peroxidase family protein [Microbulbifer bruguierae]